MALQVYGIPNCGTCKKALAWLEANSADYEFINTKEHPPSRSQVEGWVTALSSKPLRNTSGQSYRALGDAKQNWSEAQWVDAFARDAMLLKRPLFVRDGEAILAGFRGQDEELRQKLGL
ncbi:MAG TPA: Spx/MgsR family RNA polymerase-binding regulatory protein [Trichocoleus sp.]